MSAWRHRHRGRAALAFVAAVLGLFVVSIALPDNLKSAGFVTPGSQSDRSSTQLDKSFGYDPEPGMVVLARSAAPYTTRAPRRALAAVAAQIKRDPSVGFVQTPFGRDGAAVLVSKDKRGALVLVHFKQVGEDASGPAIDRIRSSLRAPPGLKLQVGGYDVGFLDDNRVVREDLLRIQLIALPLLALIQILIFRGLAAALLPVVIGGLSVLGTFAGVRLLSHVVNISIYALNLATVLGLGLAVDYALFLVSRYREEARTHGAGPDALRATMSTAGRAVIFSGATVAAACCALLLFPQQFLYSMGIGGLLTSLLAAASALIVIPPLLERLGERVQPRQLRHPTRAAPPPAPQSGWWFRFAGFVMRHAVPVALVSAVVVVAAGLPARNVSWTFLDYHALPSGLTSRTVANEIQADFVPFLEYPISLAIAPRFAAHGGALSALAARVATLPGAGYVANPQRAPDGTGLLQLIPRAPPLSGESQTLIRELRQIGAPILVGGRVAEFVNLSANIRAVAPLALVLVALATLLLLFLMTGSFVLPIKALLMNSLTLFAVFGLLVAIFQDRVLGIASLISFDGPSALETTTAVVVVAVTLGLATDYTVLLLSRIKEAHDDGEPDELAIALGLERSGRVITNAALLLAMVLLVAASARVFVVKELVIGLALGVLIDASIVRACLVPALMRILGKANWWAPRRVRHAHARLAARLSESRT